MSLRVQAALASRRRETAFTPLREYNRLVLGRVTNVYHEHNLVDVALDKGPVHRGVPVLGAGGGTQHGLAANLPQIWNSERAQLKQNGQLYDESFPSHTHDTFALVGYADGYASRPFVLGFLSPNSTQLSLPHPNQQLDRHVTDIHELKWSDESLDLRKPPFGAASPDHPDELLYGNWQLIFPDRQRDYPVPYRGAGKGQTKAVPIDPLTDFGNDHQTFIAVGYHDRPRVFGDGSTSANYDNDRHPWGLSLHQKGDKDERDGAGFPIGQQHARQIVLNQRWRSRLWIDQHGEVTLRAEGLCFDSTEYQEQQKSFGRMQLWSRLETTTWQKQFGQWVRMRPRYDGKDPESERTAKKTGTAQLRVQRAWDVAVRKDAEFRVRDSFTLHVGDFDTKWNQGELGVDPGTLWESFTDPRDKPVLNPNFRAQVGDDRLWKGEDFMDSANVDFHFTRPADARATGQQTFTWTMDPKKPATDVLWTYLGDPQDGRVDYDITLRPGPLDDAKADTLVLGQQGRQVEWLCDSAVPRARTEAQATPDDADNGTTTDTYCDLAVAVAKLFASSTTKSGGTANSANQGFVTIDAGSGTITIQMQGLSHTATIVLDATTGNVNISGNQLTFNGTPLTVP
jgi:hypothetical protein